MDDPKLYIATVLSPANVLNAKLTTQHLAPAVFIGVSKESVVGAALHYRTGSNGQGSYYVAVGELNSFATQPVRFELTPIDLTPIEPPKTKK